MTRTIAWDLTKLTKLKKAFAEHKGDDVLSITVQPEGKLEFVPGYAKYLIEYLEPMFKVPPAPAAKANEGEESYTPGSGSWEGEMI